MDLSRRTSTHSEHEIVSLPQPCNQPAVPSEAHLAEEQEAKSQKEEFSEAMVRFCCQSNSALKLKVIIIGDAGVGKSSLLQRYTQNTFKAQYKVTVGVDFAIQNFIVCGRPFQITFWDTAGSERFKSLAPTYYRNAHAIVAVYDVTNYHNSLPKVEEYVRLALSTNAPSKPPIFLVGNKCDRLTQGSMKAVELRAKEVAGPMNAELWNVSALTSVNVENFFRRMVAISAQNCVLKEHRQCGKLKPSAYTGSNGHSLIGKSIEKTSHKLSCCNT